MDRYAYLSLCLKVITCVFPRPFSWIIARFLLLFVSFAPRLATPFLSLQGWSMSHDGEEFLVQESADQTWTGAEHVTITRGFLSLPVIGVLCGLVLVKIFACCTDKNMCLETRQLLFLVLNKPFAFFPSIPL